MLAPDLHPVPEKVKAVSAITSQANYFICMRVCVHCKQRRNRTKLNIVHVQSSCCCVTTVQSSSQKTCGY